MGTVYCQTRFFWNPVDLFSGLAFGQKTDSVLIYIPLSLLQPQSSLPPPSLLPNQGWLEVMICLLLFNNQGIHLSLHNWRSRGRGEARGSADVGLQAILPRLQGINLVTETIKKQVLPVSSVATHNLKGHLDYCSIFHQNSWHCNLPVETFLSLAAFVTGILKRKCMMCIHFCPVLFDL